jgi:hypothetical protein
MFDQKHQIKAAGELHPLVYMISSVTMVILAIMLIWLGVNPEEMITLIRSVI